MNIPNENQSFAEALQLAQTDLLQAAEGLALPDADDSLCAAAQVAAVRWCSANILTEAAGLRSACQRQATAGDADQWQQRAGAVEASAQTIRNTYAGLRELPLQFPGADELVWRLATQTQGRFAVAKFSSQWAEFALFELVQALVRSALVLRQLTHDAEIIGQLVGVLAAQDRAMARDSVSGMVDATGAALQAARAAFAGARREVEALGA